jgi:hypothetical protein
MDSELAFVVEGLPPAKGEARSILAAGHPHNERVVRLLEAARRSQRDSGLQPIKNPVTVGLEVVVQVSEGTAPGDATNYLGGIGDVLQKRRVNIPAENPAAPVSCSAFDDDGQIREVHYREQLGDHICYWVRIWPLESYE